MDRKQIEGFDNYYVTPEGLVSNKDKKIKIQMSNHNVPFVRLYKDGKYYTFSISKLVALTFLGQPLHESDVVCYKDGNNHNYNVDNLYWASRSESYSKFYKEKNRYSETRVNKLRKTVCKPIMRCKRTTQGLVEIMRYDSIVDAARDMGVGPASIIRCLKNQNNSCMGFAWKYLNKED